MAPYILIVEDEPDIRELLNFTISRAGFDIVEAENAEDALKLLDRGAPELMIIDWMLPGMDGIEGVTTELSSAPIPTYTYVIVYGTLIGSVIMSIVLVYYAELAGLAGF